MGANKAFNANLFDDIDAELNDNYQTDKPPPRGVQNNRQASPRDSGMHDFTNDRNEGPLTEDPLTGGINFQSKKANPGSSVLDDFDDFDDEIQRKPQGKPQVKQQPVESNLDDLADLEDLMEGGQPEQHGNVQQFL